MAAMKAGFAYACALLCFVTSVAFSAPALADDADLKKQVEQGNAAYMKSFNSMDVAGLAEMYATGAVIVIPEGPRTDIAQLYEGMFKTGFNHAEITVDQVWLLGSDAALGMGKYRVTGKSREGGPIEAAGLWTATYVREGGKWKTRMLSAIPQPPSPQPR
jgi:ketosteroid isomerase-like protein